MTPLYSDLAEAEFQLTDLLQQTNGAQLDERLDGVAAEMDGLEKDVEEMYKDLKAYVESLGFEVSEVHNSTIGYDCL